MNKKYFAAAIAVLIVISIAAGCGAPGVRLETSAQDQFDLAKKEYDKKHWLKSIEGFQKVIFNFPGADIVDTAQYYLSMSYFNNKEYELSAVEFQRLMTNYPQSAYYDEAQYMNGVSYLENTPGNFALDQEDLKRAIQVLQDFIIDNPDSPLVEEARQVILEGRTKLARKEYENGMLYFKLKQFKSAGIYFQMVIDEYTDTRYAAMSQYRVAEIDYKKKAYAESLIKFNNFITVYPESEMVPDAEEYVEKINSRLETVDVPEES